MARRPHIYNPLRQSEDDTSEAETPDWELAALDKNGDELYRTEYQDSRAEAEHAAQTTDPANHDGVARFVAVHVDK